jgi:plastocyanin
MSNHQLPGLYSRLFFIIFLLFSPILAQAATHDVAVLSNRFLPNDLTIEVGDTVRWTNGGAVHDVTADDGSFASQTSGSFVYSRTFMSVAEILYHCTVHSSPGRNISSNMNGRVNVIEASPNTDVSVESVDAADGSSKAGEDLQVITQLKNNSAVDSGVFDINFYASSDNTITASDTLVGTKQVSNIAAGASLALDENINLPAGLAVGDYFIGAILNIGDTNPGNDTNVDQTAIFVFTQFIMNSGLNDAWFNPATSGQGFFITVFPDLNFVILAWFTYDTELPLLDATANLGDPGHRWMTAGGVIVNDTAVMNIEFTSGGIFDAASTIERTDPAGSDGTLTLKFDNCNAGTIEYDINSINTQGTVPIKRVANDNVALCIALLKESLPAQ